MKNKDIDTHPRKSAIAVLNSFCPFSAKDKGHYIEVTDWANGEGVDVVVEGVQRVSFRLTHGQYDALKACMKELNP